MQEHTVMPLSVPIPPMLAEALGYPGQARLVAFHWSSSGDEAVYTDGRCSGDADWLAYLAFIEHPLVEPQLRPFDLESLEEEAQQWLVLDREERTLSVLPAQDAAALLQQQWCARPAPLPVQWKPLDPIPHLLATLTGKAGWRAVSLDMALVPELRPDREARRADLRAWLDAQPAQEDAPTVSVPPKEDAMPHDTPSTTTSPDRDKEALLQQMAALLQVARKEWPQQTDGTQWASEVEAALAQYRRLHS